MTEDERRELELGNLRAGIEKMLAEARRLEQEYRFSADDRDLAAEVSRLELQQMRLMAAKLNAETATLQLETRWPPVIIAALMVAIIGPSFATLIAVLAR